MCETLPPNFMICGSVDSFVCLGGRWDWLLRRQSLLRLTPFPSARRGGTSKLTSQDATA